MRRNEINVADEPVYDPWSALDFKAATVRASGRTTQLAPDWTSPHRRRLTAYNVLRAFLSNTARRLMDVDGRTREDLARSDEARQQHREYGDAAALRDAIRQALLGDTQSIVVDGAKDFDPDLAAPEPPDDPNAPAPEDGPTPEELADNAEAERAFSAQEWYRDWAARERLSMKMIDSENNAVGLGDGVYSLGFSLEKNRVRLRIWDPSFYFPVLEDGASEDDFPRRVHLAWEMQDPSDDTKTLIRRITWELGPIAATSQAQIETWRATGELVDPSAKQTLPWNEGATTITCYMTDATFTLDGGKPAKVDDLSLANATFASDEQGEIRMRDLKIDFVPVVHVPNTVSELDHFGQSSIAVVAQVLDDLANADTDLSKTSGTTGFPPVAIEGAMMGGDATYEPGQVWELPMGGKLQIVDTSGSLDALLKYVESLLKRASVNAHVPEEWLGRIDQTTTPPAGVSRRLSFGPLERMTREMRLVRDEKYPLLLKFVWRLSRANGLKGAPESFIPASVELGSFMPADLSNVVEMVAKLRTKTEPPSISLETAVGLLIEAGMSIDDAVTEVNRIEQRDFAGADQLLTATGDEGIVFDYLGREPTVAPGVPAPPTPTLPPTPGQGGAG